MASENNTTQQIHKELHIFKWAEALAGLLEIDDAISHLSKSSADKFLDQRRFPNPRVPQHNDRHGHLAGHLQVGHDAAETINS